jgi:protoporphyrinogen oxidase
MVKDPKNTVWLGLEYFCEKGDEMWELLDKEFIDLAAEEAVKIGIIENTCVLDSVRIKVEKAYPSYFGTYEQFDVVRNYLSGIENLYCIGRNGQHRYNNMDHSMLTAIEAVRLITTGDPGKESLFKVNTESEYHESR